MVIEKPKIDSEEELLNVQMESELGDLRGEVENLDSVKKYSKPTTKYHTPEMDNFRSQQLTGNEENHTNTQSENFLDKKDSVSVVVSKLKISLPSLKNRADELVKEHLDTLVYIKNIKDSINPSINDIVEKKLMKDIDFTNNIIKKYENLNGEEKPDFFPFFCACKGYEKLDEKPKNGCLAIVDFSTTTVGNSKNKAKKAKKNDSRVNEGRLFLMNMNTNEITFTTDKTPQGWGGKEYSDAGAGFSNASGSLKSSLGFTQVANSRPVNWKNPNGQRKNIPPEISLEGSTGPHVVLAGLEKGINDNTTIRQMYAHGGTFSEGCTVVYGKEERQIFLNSLIGRDPNLPVENGGKGNSRGVIFTYSSNEKDYLEKSNYLA